MLLIYMLVSPVGLVVFGRVADLFGRQGTYLLGFVVFTVASLLAGFSPSIEALLAARYYIQRSLGLGSPRRR
ncbi:MFS transporter [Nonomuraea sp. NPDC052129]|uniref:MFS transporter n=1 Tax=unclassified Nonomuraea TaxID=2593643 RepID=UPI0034235ECD